MSSEKLYPEGLLGRKLGMTQVFTDEGVCIPVSILQLGPCFVLDVKTDENNGYNAVQLGFAPKKQQRVNKPEQGHLKRAGRGAFYFVREIRCDVDGLGWGELGKELSVGEVFSAGEFVDVTGTSIGRGFSGVVRRYGVRGQPATRGTHEYRRNIGSIGCRKSPGRVFKNRKMPGQMGAEKVTTQNLKVIAVRPEDNVILVKGAVPGSKNGFVTVHKAMKRYLKTMNAQAGKQAEKAA